VSYNLQLLINLYFLIQHRKHLRKVLSKPGPYSDEDWVPGSEAIGTLESSKIL
jgi:hypothetical protein